MYTKEELKKIDDELQNLKKENLHLHCHFFDDFFSIDNNNIIFKNIYTQGNRNGVFKFRFQHKELGLDYGIEVEVSLTNYSEKLSKETINPNITLYTYEESNFLNKEKMNITKLSLIGKKLTGQLLSFVSDLFLNLDFDDLNSKFQDYNIKMTKKNKIFRKYIKYKYNLSLQENRKIYHKQFSLLTKKRTIEEVPSSGTLSFCFLTVKDSSFNDRIEINSMNIFIKEDGFYNGNIKISNEDSFLRHFLNDSIYLKNRFISNIEELSNLINIEYNNEKSLSFSFENFDSTFSKEIIKDKMDIF